MTWTVVRRDGVPRARLSGGREGERAKKMENPTTSGPIENAATRYAALAQKFEAARKHRPFSKRSTGSAGPA
jgi:hypothetical protein